MVSSAVVSDETTWQSLPDGGSWSRYVTVEVTASKLDQTTPRDSKEFCPNFAHLTTVERVHFWLVLISAMAKFESGLDPNAEYRESFFDQNGKPVVSRGLLQISKESANAARYSCGISAEGDLHKPEINLKCGVKILAAWVRNDNVIAVQKGDGYLGGARYWAVLRPSSKLSAITEITRGTSFCRAPPKSIPVKRL